jgi:hypothetical protein
LIPFPIAARVSVALGKTTQTKAALGVEYTVATRLGETVQIKGKIPL